MGDNSYGSHKRYPLYLVPEGIDDHQTFKNGKDFDSCRCRKKYQEKKIDDLMNSGVTIKDALETENDLICKSNFGIFRRLLLGIYASQM